MRRLRGQADLVTTAVASGSALRRLVRAGMVLLLASASVGQLSGCGAARWRKPVREDWVESHVRLIAAPSVSGDRVEAEILVQGVSRCAMVQYRSGESGRERRYATPPANCGSGSWHLPGAELFLVTSSARRLRLGRANPNGVVRILLQGAQLDPIDAHTRMAVVPQTIDGHWQNADPSEGPLPEQLLDVIAKARASRFPTADEADDAAVAAIAATIVSSEPPAVSAPESAPPFPGPAEVRPVGGIDLDAARERAERLRGAAPPEPDARERTEVSPTGDRSSGAPALADCARRAVKKRYGASVHEEGLVRAVGLAVRVLSKSDGPPAMMAFTAAGMNDPSRCNYTCALDRINSMDPAVAVAFIDLHRSRDPARVESSMFLLENVLSAAGWTPTVDQLRYMAECGLAGAKRDRKER